METLKIIFTTEFLNHIKEHSDLWIGYWVSIFGGAGGVTLIISNPIWEFVGIIGGIMLTICSIILTIVLTIKAWWGYLKVKQDVRIRLLQEERDSLANKNAKLNNQKQDLANQKVEVELKKESDKNT